MWQTFLAWSALRREGLIADSVTWEEFSERLAEQVEMQGLPGTETAALNGNGTSSADPTPVPVEPG